MKAQNIVLALGAIAILNMPAIGQVPPDIYQQEAPKCEPGNPDRREGCPRIKEGKGCVRVVVLPGQTLKEVCASIGMNPKPGAKDMCCE